MNFNTKTHMGLTFKVIMEERELETASSSVSNVGQHLARIGDEMERKYSAHLLDMNDVMALRHIHQQRQPRGKPFQKAVFMLLRMRGLNLGFYLMFHLWFGVVPQR